MKAHYMQYIVDLYGDSPYFEAFKGQQNLTPVYTDDAVIYKELIKEPGSCSYSKSISNGTRCSY
jgi:hypothetical protein